MRLSFVLLVATAAALLGTGNALPAASATIPTVESPDLVPSLEVGNQAGAEKRFLRSHQVVEEDNDDEEERKGGNNLFAEWKLKQMMSSVDTFKRFKKWKAYGLSPGTVANRLEKKDLFEKYKEIYFMYLRNYNTI